MHLITFLNTPAYTFLHESEANKNYTKSSMVTKAFDRILNQGWLHFNSIEKGLSNEDKSNNP